MNLAMALLTVKNREADYKNWYRFFLGGGEQDAFFFSRSTDNEKGYFICLYTNHVQNLPSFFLLYTNTTLLALTLT